MSTRAVVNFYETWNGGEKHLRAKIYRHGDGNPDGLGKDLREFLKIVKKTLKDTRFNDASYLAAKWVVHDAERMAKYRTFDYTSGERLPVTNPLDFLSVGIIMENPGDIDYEYDVVCEGGIEKEIMPKITHRRVH
jgi:hypothetical protein